jgi:hypothetical protein
MKRSRLEILLIMVAVLALSAGVVAGLLASRLPRPVEAEPLPGPLGPPSPEGSLAEQVNLSDAQREDMKRIWEGVHGDVHKTFEQAQLLEKERDMALVGLLNDEQKAKFEKISSDFADRFDSLAKERDAIFDKAVAQTDPILSESQRKTYHELLAKHVRREPPPRARIFTAPATQPATQESH